jgi:hypothetical protein
VTGRQDRRLERPKMNFFGRALPQRGRPLSLVTSVSGWLLTNSAAGFSNLLLLTEAEELSYVSPSLFAYPRLRHPLHARIAVAVQVS